MAKKSSQWNAIPCPECKEPVSPNATRCPHCQVEYSEEQRRQLKSDAKVGLIGCGIITLLLVLGLAYCSSGDDEEANTPVEASPVSERPEATDNRATDEELAAARDQATETFPPLPMPDFASEPPITGLCRTEQCELSQVQFVNQNWPQAWQGDFDAQRNVAYCLSTGCDGAVLPDQTSACTWIALAVSARPEDATDADATNVQQYCGNLTDTQRALSAGKLEALIEAIY